MWESVEMGKRIDTSKEVQDLINDFKREFRLNSDLELAKSLNISRQNISNWRKNNDVPKKYKEMLDTKEIEAKDKMSKARIMFLEQQLESLKGEILLNKKEIGSIKKLISDILGVCNPI